MTRKESGFEKSCGNYKTVAEHSKVVSARDGYKTQLEAAQNALKDLKDVDVGELKGKISTLTNELNTQKPIMSSSLRISSSVTFSMVL